MSILHFRRTQPAVHALDKPAAADAPHDEQAHGLAGIPMLRGCTGHCHQGRAPCNCDLAMPCAQVEPYVQPQAAEPCCDPLDLRERQDLYTTPDALWDGIPLSRSGRRLCRLYVMAVACGAVGAALVKVLL